MLFRRLVEPKGPRNYVTRHTPGDHSSSCAGIRPSRDKLIGFRHGGIEWGQNLSRHSRVHGPNIA